MDHFQTEARYLDSIDELASFCDEFVIADPNLIYLDGNSLGRLPLKSRHRSLQVIEQEWGENLVRSWSGGDRPDWSPDWYSAPSRLGDKLGQILGASPEQVIICDSTSVNLYKLVIAALNLRPGRKKLISDRANFPSDLYIIQGCIQLLNQGHRLVLVDTDLGPSGEHPQVSPDKEVLSEQVVSVENENISRNEAIDPDTALVVLSHVSFKAGILFDIEAITAAAHATGALVVWDLSHSAGVVPVHLDQWGVDFAVGCTYKYLNGGPGAPAYLYVNRQLQDRVQSPVWGWFGQDIPFAFNLEYTPAAGIRRFLAGTPPILSLLAMEAGLDLTLEAGVDKIRDKSVRLTEFLIRLFGAKLAPLGFELTTPRSSSSRGSHISLRHPENYRINRALIEEMKVIPDFREPDNLRLGLAPLYTSYMDVWEGVERIRRVVTEKRYQRYSFQRSPVT